MKRITLLLAALLATQITFAQEEVAIEQNINQRINALYIGSGWNVKLIHHEADSGYRVAIITEEDLAARAYNVQLCNVKDQTLTILENTQLPRGTVVEVEGPMNFSEIFIFRKATVVADYIVASAASTPKDWTNLELAQLSRFHVRHYHIPDSDNSPNVEIWDRAQLTIDSISGEGNALVDTYEGSFQYGANVLHGKITIREHENKRDWPYWKKNERVITTKEIDGKIVSSDYRKIWEPSSVMVNSSLGFLTVNSPKDANSPFLERRSTSLKLGVDTYFNLSDHWGVRTGIMVNSITKSLSHQVKYENNELVVIDGLEEFQYNQLACNYIGIPITLYYYLGKQQSTSVSLDCFVGWTWGGRLYTSIDPTKFWGFKNWNREKIDIFNPWKLEVGLSFNTQWVGIIHGIRIFTNLLPEYKPGVTTDKFRSFGIEIKL